MPDPRIVPIVAVGPDDDDERAAWREALDGVIAKNAYCLGAAVDDFEARVREALGVRHALGVSNGTDALRLGLAALEVGPGDEVVVPAFTFFATASTVAHLGAKPVFIIGMPRSGSTWLMWLLARHPEVVIIQQSALFMPLQRLEDWWTEDHRFSMNGKDAPAPAKPRDLRDPKEAGYGNGAYAMHRSTSVLATEELHRHCRGLCREFIGTLVRGTPGAKYLVDQTPEHIEFIPLIRAILPEAQERRRLATSYHFDPEVREVA